VEMAIIDIKIIVTRRNKRWKENECIKHINLQLTKLVWALKGEKRKQKSYWTITH
jgi:hypothetical protein